jgi:leader peptidase (prepilin peptidase)/N-methyltransferase
MELFNSVMVFLFGLVIGSFLNVVIFRIPKGESISYPASHCQSCHTPLKWYHNIPLLSWIFLGGKCAFCKEKISKQYPIVELTNAIIYLLLFFKLGFVWYMPFVTITFSALLALVMIDFEYMAVPDSINFFALATSLIQPDYIEAIIHASIAAGGLWLIGFISSVIAKKEAMGGADVIVAGTMGALLGFPNFFIAIFLSAILAMIPSLLNRESGVPFVPFLAIATFIVYIYDIQTLKLVEHIIYG